MIHAPAQSACTGTGRNQTRLVVDRHSMTSPTDHDHAPGRSCTDFRELISASADDELSAVDQARLDGHLVGCAECDAFVEQVARLTRLSRMRSVLPEADLVERVMARATPPRLGRGAWVRPALAWCGVVVAVQSMRPLLFGELAGTPTHVARHVGASALALAVGFLYAARRPHKAYGLLPLVGGLLITTLFGALLDVLDGARRPAAEAVHLAELVGIVLLWLVAGSPGLDRLTMQFRRRRPPPADRLAHPLGSR
jgi:predicted anti-sigma-YlaC factor YlaD